MTILIAVIQGLWALVLFFIAFTLKKIMEDLKANTTATQSAAASVTSLHVEVLSNYTRKDDHNALRDRVHGINNQVQELKVREELARGND